ncbi:MAG: hypothetical protein ACUVQP_06500 [Bacteroidales bacterium]
MKFFLVILLILMGFIFPSCKKEKENKLIGEWKLLPQTAADRNDTVIYRFESNHILYRIKNGVWVDTGDYEVQSEFFKYYVVIKNLNQFDDANYYIEKINKDVLILQCYSPYLRKEFVKNE